MRLYHHTLKLNRNSKLCCHLGRSMPEASRMLSVSDVEKLGFLSSKPSPRLILSLGYTLFAPPATGIIIRLLPSGVEIPFTE